MKTYKRARRRQLLATRYKRTAKLQRWFYGNDIPHEIIMKLMNNFTNCSCPYCRNERTNKCLHGQDKLTMQERKANERYKYEILSIRE